MISEEERLEQKLLSLEAEHLKLKQKIASEQKNKTLDSVSIQRLKKQKLFLKDEIAKLRSYIYPDMGA